MTTETDSFESEVPDASFRIADCEKFAAATGSLGELVVAGDLYLFLSDGELHKVTVGKPFKITGEPANKIRAIK